MRSWHLLGILGLINYVLFIGLQLVSDAIAPRSLALHTEVLFLVFPLLALKPVPGLIYSLSFALLLASLRPDEVTPLLISILALYHSILFLRARLIPRNPNRIGIHCGLLQLGYVLLLSTWYSTSAIVVTTFWIRSLAEGILSALFVGVFSGLWFQSQRRLITDIGHVKRATAKQR